MRRILLGSALVLHGLAHAAIGMAAQDGAARAHAGAAEPKLIIASAAFATAVTGFVAAGFGVFGVGGLAPRWRGLAALAVVASAALLAAFPSSLGETLPAVTLDALALAAVAASSRRQPVADGLAPRPPKHPLIRGAAFAAAWSFSLYVALVILARPWQRSWGSHDDERQRPLPGDEHAGAPRRAGDRAIAIRAPASDVWPWVAQIGQDRGGFYSIVPLERLFGIHIRNADRIEPAWQSPQAGDFVRATQSDWLGGVFGDRIGWEVDHVLPGRLLALRYWIFEVEPIDAQSCRLHVRTHAGDAPVPIAPLLLLVFEPAHFVMERAMLLGIRERAEQHATAAPGVEDAITVLPAR